MTSYTLGTEYTLLSDILNITRHNATIQISAEAQEKVIKCRKYLEQKLAGNTTAIYGINTGFGSMCDVSISEDQLVQLQENLVRSHACGMGDRVPDDISRVILLLKIKNMILGHSGVRPILVEKLVDLYNDGVVPTIYQLGSLGASGDLAPLAHLGLMVLDGGLDLREKEGLAILNGTQFSLAYAGWCTAMADKLYQLANVVSTMSLDAFDCLDSPFDMDVHRVRPHKGQLHAVKSINSAWEGSDIRSSQKKYVQDPYSFRCIPQVHGATYEAIAHLKTIVNTEINSVTDNPLIFPDQDKIVSGGNFHAQPLALGIDYLSTAIAELGSISERRIYQLINGDRNLPQFLVDEPGLNSGFMIVQYTAASIASKNKQLATPASIDSIVSCKGQEDHVSMAANAGTACYQVVKNVQRILSLELLVASQALDYRRPGKSSPKVESLHTKLRASVSHYDQDRTMTTDICKAEATVADYLSHLELH